jgi:hypothetical protein
MRKFPFERGLTGWASARTPRRPPPPGPPPGCARAAACRSRCPAPGCASRPRTPGGPAASAAPSVTHAKKTGILQDASAAGANVERCFPLKPLESSLCLDAGRRCMQERPAGNGSSIARHRVCKPLAWPRTRGPLPAGMTWESTSTSCKVGPPEMCVGEGESRGCVQKETIVRTWGRRGASGTCTDSGPPLRMMTRGAASLISSCDTTGACCSGNLEAGRHAASTTPASSVS